MRFYRTRLWTHRDLSRIKLAPHLHLQTHISQSQSAEWAQLRVPAHSQGSTQTQASPGTRRNTLTARKCNTTQAFDSTYAHTVQQTHVPCVSCLLLHSKLQEGQLVVCQFQFLRWSAYRDVPDSKKAFLNLLAQVHKWQRECGEGRTVVHCLWVASKQYAKSTRRYNAMQKVCLWKGLRQWITAFEEWHLKVQKLIHRGEHHKNVHYNMVNHDPVCVVMVRDFVVSYLCGVWSNEMHCNVSFHRSILLCGKSDCGVMCCTVGWCSVCRCVPLCCPKPPERTPADEYEWAVQLIANSSHVHPHHPQPKAHRSGLSHSVTHDNQGRDYGDQINYGLMQNAMVLTTVNPGLPKRWRRLITLILLVYAAEAPVPTFTAFVSGERKWISSSSLLILPFIYDEQDNISEATAHFAIISQFSLTLQPF